MKVRNICFAFLFLSESILVAQPTVEWRQSLWPLTSVSGSAQSAAKSGEDWFLGHTINIQNGQAVGYIAVGYSEFVDYIKSNLPVYQDLPCSFDQPHTATNCADMRNGQWVVGPFPTIAFADLQGNYGTNYYKVQNFTGYFYSVVQLNGYFYAVGYCDNRKDLLSPYSPFAYNGNNYFDYNIVGCNQQRHSVIVKMDGSGNVSWIKLYGKDPFNAGNQLAIAQTGSTIHDAVVTSDGAMICAVLSDGGTVATGQSEMHAIKVDANGNVIWIKYIATVPNAGSYIPDGFAIARAMESGSEYYYLSGTVDDGTHNTNVPFVTKIDASGTFQWSSTSDHLIRINTPANTYNRITKVAVDNQGNIIVPVAANAAITWSGGQGDGMVFKLSPTNGSVIAQSTSDIGRLKAYDFKFGVAATSDGGFAAASTKRTFTLAGPIVEACTTGMDPIGGDYAGYNSDAYVVKYNRDMEKEWDIEFDANTLTPLGTAVGLLDIAACTVPGNTACPATNNPNWKFPDPNSLDVRRQECIYTIVQAPDGGLVIAGNNSSNMDDSYLAKIGSICNISRTFANVTVTATREVVNSGPLYVSNITLQNNAKVTYASSRMVILQSGTFDPGSLALIDPSLTCIPTTTFYQQHREDQSDPVAEIVINNQDNMFQDLNIQLYPNPTQGIFNATVYSSSSKVKIFLQNQTGQSVMMQELECANGECSTVFDFHNQPKGVYFVTVQDGGKKLVKKIVLI